MSKVKIKHYEELAQIITQQCAEFAKTFDNTFVTLHADQGYDHPDLPQLFALVQTFTNQKAEQVKFIKQRIALIDANHSSTKVKEVVRIILQLRDDCDVQNEIMNQWFAR